ncbi:asparaginase domain-containing protein [Marinobacter sp. F4216]|uniref:asparaginase domain-containing protein n=1 Tax=Marinobacter sp. F4216 TaxID=2874281 RepID=UPI001CBBE3C9|nr:asparaginase domain-containing protein [Marinobacter sp. F4216]MBZ2169267.1 asparaginase [Marinobacter sp. F4216]
MIQILTTGGTIDKVYFDANSEFSVGDPTVPEMLTESNIHDGYELKEVLRKDSLEMTEDDRQAVFQAASESPSDRILITHGTDTMAETASVLSKLEGKTIVLFGAMQPARMRRTDALFNLGFAWSAVSLLPPGVYIAMNGEVFEAGSVRKNLEAKRFERV